ncbi:MAG: hypothetical protein ACREOW_18155 [Thermodesulfobacteriota bacterium]
MGDLECIEFFELGRQRVPSPRLWTGLLFAFYQHTSKTVEKSVELLRKRKASVGLKIVEGVTHYDTYGFIEPLIGTIPWIRKV